MATADHCRVVRNSEQLFNVATVETTSLKDMLAFITDVLDEEITKVKKWLDLISEKDSYLSEMQQLLSSATKLKTHLEFVLAFLDIESDEDVHRLKDTFNSIAEDYKSVNSKEDMNTLTLKHAMVIMHDKMHVPFQQTVSKFFKKGAHGEIQTCPSLENMTWVRILIGRFDVGAKHLPMIFTFPKDDIFSFEKSSPLWQDLYKTATFKQVITKQEVRSSFKQMHLAVRLGYIVLGKFNQARGNLNFRLGLSLLKEAVYYGIRQKQAETQALFQLIDPKIDHAFTVWNLVDHPIVSKALDLRVPVVGNDDLIYIPRLFPKITKEVILREYSENTFNKLQPIDPQLLKVPNSEDDQAAILKDIFIPGDDRVQIRILASKTLNIKRTKPGFVRKAVNVIYRHAPNDETAIIIHLHGGGFVSMSSQAHKTYLNRWIKNLKLVHFSVDYRLAPRNRYPDALDDVWQAYLWIMNYAETVLGIKKKKVIIAGDSAGGNLAVALTLRLIRAGIEPPHGCLLIYPCLSVDKNSSSPSYFLSLDDPLLPFALLKLVAVAYTGDGDFKNLEDPFISPIRVSDELIAKMPPVRIVAGSEDPLYDDNWRFIAKMRKHNRDVKIIVHEHLSHAFLCHQDMKNYNVFIEEACDQIRELISLTN